MRTNVPSLLACRICFGSRHAAAWALWTAALFISPITHIAGTLEPPHQWEQHDGYRLAQLEVQKGKAPGFTSVSPSNAGIAFTNRLASLEAAPNNNLMNGSGVAVGDFDGDGWCDIYFCAIRGTNALYRNLGGWRFEDVTKQAGVGLPLRQSTGAVFADIDGDGDLDLLVSTLGEGVHCFGNDGACRFIEVTAEAGTGMETGSTSMALADVDGDGDLDLYVANYGAISILRSGGRAEMKRVGNEWVFVGPYAKRLRFVDGRLEEVGEADVLFLNDGSGHFTPVPWDSDYFLDEAGRPKPPPLDFGLTVQMRDINGDLWPDIYVCNDFQTVDRIWLNDGRGKFRALPRLAMRKQCFSSMGVDFADIDRDGHLDFCATEMLAHNHENRIRQIVGMAPLVPIPGRIDNRPEVARNTLFWNRGDGTYAEIANFAGVAATDWTWQPAFLDVDLDGFEDLLIVNGMLHDVQDRDVLARIQSFGRQPPEQARTNLLLYPPFITPNFAFRNRHDLTFEEASRKWGFDSESISQGMAFADFDCDGDMDIVINCMNAPPLLLRNECSEPRIAIRLKGKTPNTRGIGAVVKVSGGPVAVQSQEILAGGRYLSSDEPMRVFATGSAKTLRVEVAWRSGRKTVLEDAQANCIYEFYETAGDQKSSVEKQGLQTAGDEKKETPPNGSRYEQSGGLWFRDLTAALAHTHHEVIFNDYARQPLLTRQLSALGPALAMTDLDGDGADDLVVGTGRGGDIAVFRWVAGMGFKEAMPERRWQAIDDVTGMTLWANADGTRALLLGLANYESGATNGPMLLELRMVDRVPRLSAYADPQLLAYGSSPGPLSSADVDGNGELDLVVGMRVTPGAYPTAAGSKLYRQVNGRLVLDKENTEQLKDVGMASGIAWTDLEPDGYPDLLLACEWGPVRIFRNQKGKLTAWDAPVRMMDSAQTGTGLNPSDDNTRLSSLTGWWSSVACGDFDEDGRLDFVVGNWGRNDAAQITDGHALRLFYGDLAGHGVMDLVECYYAPDRKAEVPRRNLNALSQAFPMLLEHYPSHAAFGRATIDEVLACLPNKAAQVEAAVLDTMVFLNRGDHLVAKALPAQAQWTPVFGMVVADADGDGHEDLYLAQNFFALRPEWPRLDAGRGLWLRGDGKGGFFPVPGQESGVTVYGEQRGAAIGDFNRDGRWDLVVAQNGGATCVFENMGGRPGLRLRLAGPLGNPDGVGAVLRLGDGKKWGQARLVCGGSGYWSQNSVVQVMHRGPAGDRLQIVWPGGKRTEVVLPRDAGEVLIGESGVLKSEGFRGDGAGR